MRWLVTLALPWACLFGLASLDEAVIGGSPPNHGGGDRNIPPPTSTPIIMVTTLLGGLGYLLTQEIRGEELGGTPRKPARALVGRLGVRGWQVGMVCAMGFAWAMQAYLFAAALDTPGWSRRPILLGLLAVVLLTYAGLTLRWGIRYIPVMGRRNALTVAKPVPLAGAWDRDLDHGLACGSGRAS